MKGLRAAAVLVVVLLLGAAAGVAGTFRMAAVERARGVDVGDPVVWVLALGRDAEGRTDTIQLVGLDSRSGAAAAIGIPRDTWMALPGLDRQDRINVAYREGGADAALAAVARLTGITADYLVAVDFTGFRRLMDAVGPVRVVSPRGFVSHGVRVRRGANRLDARASLAYVRHRVTLPQQDFDRSANAQRLLRAVLERLQSRAERAGYAERLALQAVGALTTDLEAVDVYRLVQALSVVDTGRLTSCVLTGTPAERFGASVVLVDGAAARAVGADAVGDAVIDSCRS